MPSLFEATSGAYLGYQTPTTEQQGTGLDEEVTANGQAVRIKTHVAAVAQNTSSTFILKNKLITDDTIVLAQAYPVDETTDSAAVIITSVTNVKSGQCSLTYTPKTGGLSKGVHINVILLKVQSKI